MRPNRAGWLRMCLADSSASERRMRTGSIVRTGEETAHVGLSHGMWGATPWMVSSGTKTYKTTINNIKY